MASRKKSETTNIEESDGTDSSDLDEYDPNEDSEGSLRDFIVPSDEEDTVSNYSCSESECSYSSCESSGCENTDDDYDKEKIITTPRRSKRPRSQYPQYRIVSSDDDDSDIENRE